MKMILLMQLQKKHLLNNHLIRKVYTQATSRCRIQLELETSLSKALIEDNGYSGVYAPAFSKKLHPCSVLVKINNVA